jgi:inhibitor of KinA
MNATQIGESAVAFMVSLERTAECVRIVRSYYDLIRAQAIPEIISLRPALDTILVQFQPDYDWKPFVSKIESITLAELAENSKAQDRSRSVVRIPVCYEEPFATDLKGISAKTGFSIEEIIQKHCSVSYEVWMLGFMPGFPYLGELPGQLQIARKPEPEQNIPSGSVAIAEEYCGIYPFQSPGGWHVIGRTPMKIVDYRLKQPWLLNYGERVEFYPISSTDFDKMRDDS